MHLAENLKFLREQRRKTQQEMANLFGVEQITISSWECGSRIPTIGMVVELAKYHGVTLDELVLKDLRPPIPLYMTNLRFLRTKHEMTQEGMSKLLGVSKASYCKYENGSVDIGIEKLSELADFFGVTLDQMVKQDLSKEA